MSKSMLIPITVYPECWDCKERIEEGDTFHVKEEKPYCNKCWADEIGAPGREE